MPFGLKKIQWLGYPEVKFFLNIMFIRFDRIIHECDGQTDTP